VFVSGLCRVVNAASTVVSVACFGGLSLGGSMKSCGMRPEGAGARYSMEF
jgi:hypothetical protein